MEIYADPESEKNKHKWMVKTIQRQYYLFTNPTSEETLEQFTITNEYEAIQFMLKIFENLHLEPCGPIKIKEDMATPVLQVSLKLGK
jgi:hypothetical protein